jgi:hypothetical protein
MHPQAAELLRLLQAQIAEHKRLIDCLARHASAIKAMNLAEVDLAVRTAAQLRQRLATLELRRKAAADVLANTLKLGGRASLAQIASALPNDAAALFAARDELRKLIEQARAQAHIASRVAGAVLGHLNTVVRLVGTAVKHAGVYTRSGNARVSRPVGLIEAVG